MTDFTLPGDSDTMRGYRDGLNNANAELVDLPEDARLAYDHALDHWTGGGRRRLYQHAAAGIQAEVLVLLSATSSVADLVDSYFAAHHASLTEMDSLRDWLDGKELEQISYPSEEGAANLKKLRRTTDEDARQTRRDLHRLARLIAGDIDNATNLLCPGGANLPPDQIVMKIHDGLGGINPGQHLSNAEILALLDVANKAVPDDAVKENGEFDLEAFLADLNDKVGAGTTLGGTGWALRNLMKYRVSAVDLARQTESLYAQIVGTSLEDLRAGRLSSADHVGSILRYIAEEDQLVTEAGEKNAQLLDDLRAGGKWTPAVARALATLGLLGDVYTLRHLDEIENDTEREVVKWTTIANGLGISSRMLVVLGVVNEGDAIPVWGEAVATATGIFLAGYIVYKNAPGWLESWQNSFSDGIRSLMNLGRPPHV